MARLHVIGVFHTVNSSDFSHCAFTGRALRFPKMMLPFGHEIIDYSNEGSESNASEHVTILTKSEFKRLTKLYKKEQPDMIGHTESSLCREFTKKLKQELQLRVRDGDIIVHVFGYVHQHLKEMFPNAFHLEPGIGYNTAFADFRVYETHHWQSWHHGKEQTNGGAYEWVCPMGHDIDLWEPKYEVGDYLLYFGRINELKGLYTVKEIAKCVDMKVIICGEGDVSPFLDPAIPNLEYLNPVTGIARSDLLRNAYAMLCPTVYIEPLCNSGIESQLCGAPIITTDYGAFTEIMIHGVSGFRCHTLGDYLEAIKKIPSLDRREIADRARKKYNLETVGAQMNKIITQLESLRNEGWYITTPTDAVWQN